MAGHGRGNTLDGVFHRGSTVEAFEIFGQRAKRRIALLAAEQRWKRRHAEGVAPELLHLEAQSIQVYRVGGKDLSSAGRHLDQQWLQEPLALEPSLRQPLRDALEQHA